MSDVPAEEPTRQPLISMALIVRDAGATLERGLATLAGHVDASCAGTRKVPPVLPPEYPD